MSVGVHVLGALVAHAIAMLGPDFDVEIIEAHHKMKVDAPSGTALRLAELARDARGGARVVHGREGKPGARGASEIGVHAVRGGDVVGDHTVLLFGTGERVELTHRASSRELFASGALRVARWIADKPAGRYGMDDVLQKVNDTFTPPPSPLGARRDVRQYVQTSLRRRARPRKPSFV